MKTNNMKKLVIALCLGMITIAGCKKDDKGNPSSNNKLLLSEIRLDEVLLQRIEYNDKNLVTKQLIYENDNKLIGTRIYTYNSKNLPIRISTDVIGADLSYEDYIYDNQGKPTSGTITTRGKVIWNITYQHAKNKLIQNSTSQETQSTGTNTFTFDDKGNLLKIEHVMDGSPAGTNEWYAYDNKKGAAGSTGDAISMLFSSPNNPTKEKHTYLNQVVEYDLKYTFNDAGYPTKMERYKNGTDELIDVTTYKYITAN